MSGHCSLRATVAARSARIKAIASDIFVARGGRDLDPEPLITTEGVMSLGCAVSRIAERKRSGRHSAPKQSEGRGTKVSYAVGKIFVVSAIGAGTEQQSD